MENTVERLLYYILLTNKLSKNIKEMEYYRKYKKLTEEVDEGIFWNYSLTDLMLLRKNGRKIKSNENVALTTLLRNKLEEYGMALSLNFEREGLMFRGITMLDGFPIENEPILKQLYGYNNFIVPIILRGFDDYSISFDYEVDTGMCELQKCSWGTVRNRLKFKTLREMLTYIKEKGYENCFINNKII